MTSGRRETALRIFLTGLVLYSAHFSSNVVRETYLALSLAEDLSIRVDEYLGLHPDLFEIPGRGAYINSNPGASIVGAVPYLAARPLLAILYRLRPDLLEPRPQATYDDPRPNRTAFMNEARARGLDIKLGLAAAVTQVGLMAPASALAMVVMYFFLCARLRNEAEATWLALLFGFGTPVFFRTAFLNQNLLLAHLVLVAFVALTWPRSEEDGDTLRREALAGLCLGLGILCDYSAAPLALVFGLWCLFTRAGTGGGPSPLRALLTLGAAAAGPLAVLLGYQWLAFGSPWFPAQRYMPPTPFSVEGWNGMTLPTPGLLWSNLFSPTYGLFAFCPLLAAAVAAPFLRGRAAGLAAGRELTLVFAAFGGLWLFSSANQFSNLQFNTGVRYMVPAVPLLFFASIPVLLRAPRAWVWALVLPTLAISWSVSMAREDVMTSLMRVFLMGPELPWVTVLERMASGYVPALAAGVSPIAIFAALGVVLWVIWRGGDPRRPLSGPPAA